jgi:hypothetical protein
MRGRLLNPYTTHSTNKLRHYQRMRLFSTTNNLSFCYGYNSHIAYFPTFLDNKMLLKANNQLASTRTRLYIDRLARYYVFHQVSSTQFVKTA